MLGFMGVHKKESICIVSDVFKGGILANNPKH